MSPSLEVDVPGLPPAKLSLAGEGTTKLANGIAVQWSWNRGSLHPESRCVEEAAWDRPSRAAMLIEQQVRVQAEQASREASSLERRNFLPGVQRIWFRNGRTY